MTSTNMSPTKSPGSHTSNTPPVTTNGNQGVRKPHLYPSSLKNRETEDRISETEGKTSEAVKRKWSGEEGREAKKIHLQRVISLSEFDETLKNVDRLYQEFQKFKEVRNLPDAQDRAERICMCFNKLIATNSKALPSSTCEAYFKSLGFIYINEIVNKESGEWIILQADDAYMSVPRIIAFSEAHSEYFTLLLKNEKASLDDITAQMNELSRAGIKPNEHYLVSLLCRRATELKTGNLSRKEKSEVWNEKVKPILQQIQSLKPEEKSKNDFKKIQKSYQLLIEYLISSDNAKGIKELYDVIDGYEINIDCSTFVNAFSTVMKESWLEALSMYSNILTNEKLTFVSARGQSISYVDFELEFVPFLEKKYLLESLDENCLNRVVDLHKMLVSKHKKSKVFTYVFAKISCLMEKGIRDCHFCITSARNRLTEESSVVIKEIDEKKLNIEPLEKKITERQQLIDLRNSEINQLKNELNRVNTAKRESIKVLESIDENASSESRIQYNHFSSGILSLEMEASQIEISISTRQKDIEFLQKKNLLDTNTMEIYKKMIKKSEDSRKELSLKTMPIIEEKHNEIVRLTRMKETVEKVV